MGIFAFKKNILRCPVCGATYFKDRGDRICIDHGCELIAEDEYRAFGAIPRGPQVECPYCHADDVKKISTADRMVSTGLFGMASKKLGKQWHCNKCGSDF